MGNAETGPLGVHHVAMATTNLDRLQDFYCRLMGMSLLASGAWQDNPHNDDLVGLRNSAARFVLLGSGNLAIELFEYSSPPPAAGEPDRPVNKPGLTHIGFGVASLDAEYARLSAAGVRFHCPPRPAEECQGAPIRAVYGRDPDGNVFELLEISGDTPFDYLPSSARWR